MTIEEESMSPRGKENGNRKFTKIKMSSISRTFKKYIQIQIPVVPFFVSQTDLFALTILSFPQIHLYRLIISEAPQFPPVPGYIAFMLGEPKKCIYLFFL